MDVGGDVAHRLNGAVFVVQAGQKLLAELTEFARRHNIDEARFTARGVFETCVVGWFSFADAEYVDVCMEGPVAIANLAGHIRTVRGVTEVSAHGVFTARGGNCEVGRLRSAKVRSKLVVRIGEPEPEEPQPEEPHGTRAA